MKSRKIFLIVLKEYNVDTLLMRTQHLQGRGSDSTLLDLSSLYIECWGTFSGKKNCQSSNKFFVSSP
jgi:hypothetical protein